MNSSNIPVPEAKGYITEVWPTYFRMVHEDKSHGWIVRTALREAHFDYFNEVMLREYGVKVDDGLRSFLLFCL